MTRIIGGVAGGRRIETPRGAATRPTSDRVREALFSAIESWCGSLTGLRFLDLYAGSGAIGLEAKSRGAGVVTMIEHDRRTARLIASNVQTLGFTQTNVVAQSVPRALSRPPTAPYDVVFSDPPYDLSGATVQADLALVLSEGWIVPEGLIVVERPSRGDELVWPEGIRPSTHKRYGETTLWYGHANPAVE